MIRHARMYDEEDGGFASHYSFFNGLSIQIIEKKTNQVFLRYTQEHLFHFFFVNTFLPLFFLFFFLNIK